MCGITALGYDHMAILGDTIEKIAWQKAGIMKVGFVKFCCDCCCVCCNLLCLQQGVPAFTVKQDAGGLDVIEERARELCVPLFVVPELSKYPMPFPGSERLNEWSTVVIM